MVVRHTDYSISETVVTLIVINTTVYTSCEPIVVDTCDLYTLSESAIWDPCVTCNTEYDTGILDCQEKRASLSNVIPFNKVLEHLIPISEDLLVF